MYAYLRNYRKIKFRMVSVQHFINEAPGLLNLLVDSVIQQSFNAILTLLTHLIPPVTIVTVKKVFIYKALKTLLTDVLVHFMQIWKKNKGSRLNMCSFT